MQVAIHPDYTSFYLPMEWEDTLYTRYSDREMGELRYRADPEFIQAVLSGEDEDLRELVVETIPDSTTDWTIEAFDGAEVLLYVVDGRIYRR